MLIYETEGFLEVESKDIQQLCRSTAVVSLGDIERETFDVHAVLCKTLQHSKPLCHIAFYSKALKRAFVFAVRDSDKDSSWQIGQDALAQLGFQLEDVSLDLSDAMLEVVLRNVPGLLTPANAQKQRAEKLSLLAELQRAYDEDPDNAQGKKAALKLNSEKRLNAQSEALRELLETLLASQENANANAELDALVSQVTSLTSKLQVAETLVESERSQRVMSESITVAAEKRIQELEEVLVDAETKLSKTLKQAQKNTQLKKSVKQLEEELKSTASDLSDERDKQGQLTAELDAAAERISLLENEQKETNQALEENLAKLAKVQSENSQLSEDLAKVELQAQDLRSVLKDAEQKTAQHAAAEKALLAIQTQFEEVQQSLKVSLDQNRALEDQLVAAIEQNAETQASLRATEKDVREKKQDEKQQLALRRENEQLAAELRELREEYSLECSIRKRLEKGALEEDRRIQQLEDALAKASSASEGSPDTKNIVADGREVKSLRAEVETLNQSVIAEQQSRQELEAELEETHTLIDSLEKMLREADNGSKEQHSRETSQESDNQRVQELEEQLKTLTEQLEHELVEQKRLATAFSAAEKKLIEQEEVLRQEQAEVVAKKPLETVASEIVPPKQAKPSKPLPHELRPAPKKGAFFHPDWDLEGLPCQSSKEIFKVWEAAFNVQLSLEGYPSQYCMAFLAVLKLKKEKRIVILYRLKLSEHTLVCVPAQTPKNEASLKKAIKEGLNYLRLSGFEMDEMKAENVDSTLKSYFLQD